MTTDVGRLVRLRISGATLFAMATACAPVDTITWSAVDELPGLVDNATEPPPDEPAPAADPCAGQPADVTLGFGERSFQTADPERPFPVTNGFAGGHHYWVAVTAENVPQRVTLMVTLSDLETGVIVHTSRTNVVLMDGYNEPWRCRGSYAGIAAALAEGEALRPIHQDYLCSDDPDLGPPCPGVHEVLCGRWLRAHVEVRSPEGAFLGSDVQEFPFVADPTWGPQCDEFLAPVQAPGDPTP